MDYLKSRNKRVPIVTYSDTSYKMKCPRCSKPILIEELENTNRCSNCGLKWNKYAKSLLPFYYCWSTKLLNEFWGL